MYQCSVNNKESGRGICLHENALRDGVRQHVVRDDSTLSSEEGDVDTANSASDNEDCSSSSGRSSLDIDEPRVLRRKTSLVSVSSSSVVLNFLRDQ